MKNLFEPASVDEVKGRLARLTPTSERQWGTMTPAQAVAHCSLAMRNALGEFVLPRSMLGLLFGRIAKRSLIARGDPMPRNAGAHSTVVVKDDRDLTVERRQLLELIDRFAERGSTECRGQRHFFFGPLTPVEWATLQYVHLDHHLRQFGV